MRDTDGDVEELLSIVAALVNQASQPDPEKLVKLPLHLLVQAKLLLQQTWINSEYHTHNIEKASKRTFYPTTTP